MKRLMTCFLFFASASMGSLAYAYEWTTRDLINQYIDLPAGQSRSVPLNATYQIKNIVVQARGVNSTGGAFDVMVNGEVKGTIYVPSVDPSYVVTVQEGASSIEFVSHSPGGVRIDRVMATISNVSAVIKPLDPIGILLPSNEITELSRRTIRSTEALISWSTADDQEKYLVPLKVSAGKLLAMSSSRGMASGKTAQGIQAMISQFDLAKGFFDKALTCNECFKDVVELLALRERFERAIQ